jgi:hypothetical protein
MAQAIANIAAIEVRLCWMARSRPEESSPLATNSQRTSAKAVPELDALSTTAVLKISMAVSIRARRPREQINRFGPSKERKKQMPEIKYMGKSPQERINDRLKNSGGDLPADIRTKHGEGPTRTFTNIHHSAANHGLARRKGGDANGGE